MTKLTAKEFYAGKTDGSSDLALTFITEDHQEIRLHVSRDLAHDMHIKLFQALDTLGIYKRELH